MMKTAKVSWFHIITVMMFHFNENIVPFIKWVIAVMYFLQINITVYSYYYTRLPYWAKAHFRFYLPPFHYCLFKENKIIVGDDYSKNNTNILPLLIYINNCIYVNFFIFAVWFHDRTSAAYFPAFSWLLLYSGSSNLALRGMYWP